MAESQASMLSRVMEVDGVPVKVTWKQVKRLTLAVSPPDGNVRVSAPLQADTACVRKFIKAKMSWLVRQRAAIAAQSQWVAPRYADGERHLVWGRACSLYIHPAQPRDQVELAGDELHVSLRCGASRANIADLLAAWRRLAVQREAAGKVEQWRQAMNLPPIAFAVRHMKSRWGSCLPTKGKISLNAQLSRLAPICLDGVIVHELTHFFVPNHSAAFYETMARYFPAWREVRQMLKAAAPGEGQSPEQPYLLDIIES